MGLFCQVWTTVLICTLGVNISMVFTWPATTLKLFASPNTTLNRPMTKSEVALLGSLSSVGGLIGIPFVGILLDWLGRKYSTLLSALGVVLSWTIIASIDRVEAVLTGIFVSGLTSPSFIVNSIYISEICQESIRGAMTSLNMVAYGLGTLLSYLFGGYLSYHATLYVSVSMSIAGVGVLLFLKDSPVWLMAKGREEEASQAIAYLRNVKLDSKEVLEEINQIKRALNAELDDATPEEEKTLKPVSKPKEKLSIWQFLKKSQSSRRALMVNLVIVTASIFQGLVVLQMFAEPLFEEVIPSISPTICSMLLAVSVVISGFMAAYLTERAGRRPLMIYSSFGVGICCLVLGSQIHVHWGPAWLTAVFMYLFAIINTCGSGTVPYVLIAELYLPEVKSFASMVILEWTWICNFVILFIFNPLLNVIGLGPVFYVFAAICFLTSAFCVFFLPETKGLTVDAIQTLFSKKNIPAVY